MRGPDAASIFQMRKKRDALTIQNHRIGLTPTLFLGLNANFWLNVQNTNVQPPSFTESMTSIKNIPR